MANTGRPTDGSRAAPGDAGPARPSAAARTSGAVDASAGAGSKGTAAAALNALVAQCVDRIEDEGPAALEAACREHPEHATALRSRIERLQRFGLIGDGEPPADAPLPERIGSFRILSQLGRGGMGVVYLAEQEGLGRRVALKLVRAEQLAFPGARERFRREIATVAKLQHPGIVPVYAAGDAGGVPFYAMEFVHGATLDEVLSALAGSDPARLAGEDLRRAVEQASGARGLPEEEPKSGSGSGSSASRTGQAVFAGTWPAACLRVARQVAEALQHSHERGVLHRDVKPSNVMLTPDGRALLLDFGLAARAGDQRITRTGSQLGSLAWMSPEQVRGAQELDARTDVYSLGATLHELLTLRSPFTGADAEETRARILAGRMLPIRELNPAVPRDAETVCLTAMDRERERRYASAAAFAEDLGRVLELRPVQARRPGALLKARRWSQRNPAAAAAAALAVLVAVGGPAGYGVVQARAADKESKLNDELGTANAQLAETNVQLADTNARLDGTLEELRGTNEALEGALAEEQAQRRRAERSFAQSVNAVEELLASVGAQDLRNVPRADEVRNRLLERALEFYRGLEAEAPGNADVRRESARTHRSMADLLSELGRPAEARELYVRALDEMQVLIDELPPRDGGAMSEDEMNLRHARASTLSQLARLDVLEGRYDEARAHLEEALPVLEEVVAQPGSQPEYAHDLGTLLDSLGLALTRRGQTEEALAIFLRANEVSEAADAANPGMYRLDVQRADALSKAAMTAHNLGRAAESDGLFRRSWAALEALVAEFPEDRTVRNVALECACNYGVLLLATADRATAEHVLSEGYRIALSLARDFPDEPDYAKRAAVLGINLAAELVNQGRAADADPVIVESCAQLERLEQAFPERSEVAYFLGAAYTTSSGVRLEQGRLDEAARDAQHGVERTRRAHEMLPGDPGVRAQYESALCQVADVQQASGDPQAALATMEEALALDVLRSDVLYQAVATLARCTLAARDAQALDADARAALQRRAEDLALATLEQAIAAGFTDVARVRTDDDFALLRERPELEDVLAAAVLE